MEKKLKKQLNDWQVLDKMSSENKDIRAFRQILGVDLKGKSKNKYSELKIQIDEETHQDICEMMITRTNKKIVVLYVIDRNQFDEIKFLNQ